MSQLVVCPSCKGSGLYTRHTSYTRNGKPFCFRCNGTGKVSRSQLQLSKHTKKQIVGPYCIYPPSESIETEIPF